MTYLHCFLALAIGIAFGCYLGYLLEPAFLRLCFRLGWLKMPPCEWTKPKDFK